jgi:hypothetical protein
MAGVPKKVADRLSKTVGAFQRILAEAKDRDVNESDTVTIVTDFLANVFGYDKYSDITTEQAIRGTFCDLAVKQDGKVQFLIEVKAIGLTLRDMARRKKLATSAKGHYRMSRYPVCERGNGILHFRSAAPCH